MSSSATESDAELVASVATGSERALGILYDRYVDAIYGHARRLLGDPQAAEEIVQETFLALWNRAETFDPNAGSVAAWLRSIGRHRVVDRLRAGGRGARVVSFSDLVYDGDEDDADGLDAAIAAATPTGSSQPEPAPEVAALAGETRREITAALGQLPDDERLVIELAYREGLSQSEIAARLSWPIGTVKTRTRRALRGLRAALGERVEGDPAAGDPLAGDPLESPYVEPTQAGRRSSWKQGDADGSR